MGFTSEKLHVFISYSRDDLDFADQLAAGLRVGGFDPTIDRQGISGGEDWRRRLGSLIRDAETVVFVLSPSSARSETCGWEVEEAARLGKRIVPVICRPLENAAAPPRLQNLNYVFFYAEPKSSGSGFGSGLEHLAAALNTDIDWLREHTRYLQRATEWDAGGRPENRLLSGADIALAKAWAAVRPKSAPEPTALQLDFIRASENWEARQQSEERKRLEEIARAQEERARALADTERAQKREAEASRRAEAEALRAAEEATRAASASKTVAKRTAAGLAAALVLAAIASAVGFYAVKKRQEVVAESQVAQQALRVAVAWEYTEKDPSISAAFLREARDPAKIRGWRGATSKTLEMLHYSSKISVGEGVAGIRSAKFSPDGRRIITASEDGMTRVWDAGSGQLLATLRGHTDAVENALFSPDGRRILTASDDGRARVWDADSRQVLATLQGHTGGVQNAAFSPDGRRILTASTDKTARVWNGDSGQLLATLQGHTNYILSAVFSPDGQHIVTASDDNTARVWNADSGQLLATLQGHTSRVRSAVFSPDGKRILTTSEDHTARVWDAGSGQLLAILLGHTDYIWGAVFSPDGQRIVTASIDATARIWDAVSGQENAILKHPWAVWAASFSPDGRYVATASQDGKARLWTLNGLLDSVFNLAEGSLRSADYSPDGSRLLAVGRDGADILTLLPRIESLQTLLWKLSLSCPDAQTRTDLLGQPKADAERDYHACMVQVEKPAMAD